MIDPRDYLVLDIETNGLKAERDDLLSISIYKPDDGKIYNRFLPLEKQNKLNPEATEVNGIKSRDLHGKKPLSQKEVDSLFEKFNIYERTVLTFGGSNGVSGRGFDERFLAQYFEDHGLTGFDKLCFLDFRKMIHAGGDRSFPVTKDNLCRAFGIGGVSDMHTSKNDCLLEWKLFKAMDGHHLLVTKGNVFKLNRDYVIPASYLDRFSRLREYAGIPKRYVQTEQVFVHALSKEATKALPKFLNNITGVTIEPLINAEVGAKEVNSLKRLVENKYKLDYIGSFPGDIEPIFVEKRDDGITYLSPSVLERAAQSIRDVIGPCALVDVLDLMKTKGGSLLDNLKANSEAMTQFITLESSPEYSKISSELEKIVHQSWLLEKVVRANRAIKPELEPLIDFLKNLLGQKILSQELVINQEEGCLALCDLSSEKAVVEIKTGLQGYDLSKCVNQLYYQAHGRDCYALHIEWGSMSADNPACTKFIVEKVTFTSKRPRKSRRQSEKGKQHYTIKHAITEWRYSNPDETSEKCVKSLWLKRTEVEKIWPMANPDVMFEGAPSRGQSKKIFNEMVSWRESHPEGTRLDLADNKEIPMADVERWWYQAAMPIYGGHGSIMPPMMDNKRIRLMLGDLADKSNLYISWTGKKISKLRERVRELCKQVAIPINDDYVELFGPNEHLQDEEKRFLVSKLKSLEKKCKKEIRTGIKVLRIPQHKTRYKTKRSYICFDPHRARITYEKILGKESKNIVITISEKKASVLKPEDDLYKIAKGLVDKRIERAYIERLDAEEEGQVILAVTNKPAPKWVWL